MAFYLDGIRLSSVRWVKDEDQARMLFNFHLQLPAVMESGHRRSGSMTEGIWRASKAVGVEAWVGWKLFRNLVRYGAFTAIPGTGRKVKGYRKQVWHHNALYERIR